MTQLKSWDQPITAALFGAGGGIGSALCHKLLLDPMVRNLDRYSSSPLAVQPKARDYKIDIRDEASISTAIALADSKYDLVIVALGVLQDQNVQPEKSLRAVSAANFEHVFAINTIAPSLIAKHCLVRMSRDRKTVFAALSARVGSISDNRVGGWYAYRASKAALNQVIKTAAIEHERKFPAGAVIGLHPGTVDTGLSKPFQSAVAKDSLFEPKDAATKLLSVIDQVDSSQTGRVFDWQGIEIKP